MKVTICSYDGKGYFGGPYEWIKRLGPALRTKGIEVSFLFFSDHKASDSTTYNDLKSKGFKCDLLHMHSLTQFRDNTEDRIRWVLKQVKKNPTDIFIANAEFIAMYAGKWIKGMGIPVVGVLHSDDAKNEWIYDEFIHGKEAFSLSAVVGVSQYLTSRVVSNNLYHVLTHTISCGTHVLDKKVAYNYDVLKLVYAGKLTDTQKQITETVKGLCSVVQNVPGVEVDIYGQGEQEEAIKAIIAGQSLSEKIRVNGFISSAEIHKVYLAAQVFVLLSDYEGTPVALMEAMSAGLVPVCLNIRSGIPELVIPGETGILVNDRSEEFVAAIQKLKNDSVLWNTMSTNAQAFVMKEHAMDNIADKWIDLFDVLSKESKNGKLLIANNYVLELPPVHSLLVNIDNRKMSLSFYIKNQCERMAHILKQVLFNR